MQKVWMFFPDIGSLADFVSRHCIQNAEVNASEHSLAAFVPDEKQAIATVEYGAVIKKPQSPVIC